MKKYILTLVALFAIVFSVSATPEAHKRRAKSVVRTADTNVQRVGDRMVVNFNLILDDFYLSPNQQVFLTPAIIGANETQVSELPSILLSGRNMHYVYLRTGETKATAKGTKYDIVKEVYHKSKQKQTVMYNQTVPFEDWMLGNNARIRVYIDTCGCGRQIASGFREAKLPSPAEQMLAMPFPTPRPGIGKPINHHGEARVQFEVDKIELHEDVYRYTHRITKRKHVIDNRAELQTIHDSIQYALSDPNVEIESISICGYASPESPYEHNDYLATNRSRALSEYIGRKYNIPLDRCHYSAVPENWAGFRKQVENATDITERQRKDLLELIDKTCYGPLDYDAKEEALKNDPRYADVYREKIHPDWFPQLRVTTFDIRTQLKPLTPIQLRDVMAKNPNIMSLDEIYQVANSYEHGSPEFLNAMEVALQEYPEDPIANCNAAAVAIENKDYAAAARYLEKAGDSTEANVLRGIVATANGDITAARDLFRSANSPEAIRNLRLIE